MPSRVNYTNADVDRLFNMLTAAEEYYLSEIVTVTREWIALWEALDSDLDQVRDYPAQASERLRRRRENCDEIRLAIDFLQTREFLERKDENASGV